MPEQIETKNRWEEFISPLNIPEQEYKGISIKHQKVDKDTEPFDVCHFRMSIYTGDPIEKVKFPIKTKFHSLHDEDGCWMTDLPIEQNQHNKFLDDMEGHVLVGGLGLGYAATRLALNDNVEKVTVVEIDERIVHCVKPALLLGCPEKEKVEIVTMDLFKYLRKNNVYRSAYKKNTPDFDWGFFDIWRMDGESTFVNTVVPLRILAEKRISDLICWNEDIMRGQLALSLSMNKNLPQMETLGADWTEQKMSTFVEKNASNVWVKKFNLLVPFWKWYFNMANEIECTNMYTKFASHYAWLCCRNSDWVLQFEQFVENSGLYTPPGWFEECDAFFRKHMYNRPANKKYVG